MRAVSAYSLSRSIATCRVLGGSTDGARKDGYLSGIENRPKVFVVTKAQKVAEIECVIYVKRWNGGKENIGYSTIIYPGFQ